MASITFDTIQEFIKQIQELGGASNVAEIDIRRAFGEYIATTDFVNDLGIDLPWQMFELTLLAGEFEVELPSTIYSVLPRGILNVTTNTYLDFMFSPNLYTGGSSSAFNFSIENIAQNQDYINACVIFPSKIMFNGIPSIDNVIRIQAQKSYVTWDVDITNDTEINGIIDNIHPSFRFTILYGVACLIAEKFQWSNLEFVKNTYNKFLLRIKQPRRAVQNRNIGGQTAKI